MSCYLYQRNTCKSNCGEKIAFSRNLKSLRTLHFFQIAHLREGFVCVCVCACPDSKRPYNRFLGCANGSVPLSWKEHLKALRQQRCCDQKHQPPVANNFHLPSSSFICNQGMPKKNDTYLIKGQRKRQTFMTIKNSPFFFCTHNPPLLALIKKYLKNTVAAVLLVRSTLPLESTNTAR